LIKEESKKNLGKVKAETISGLLPLGGPEGGPRSVRIRSKKRKRGERDGVEHAIQRDRVDSSNNSPKKGSTIRGALN